MDFYNLEPNKAFLISLKAAIVRDGKVLLLRSTADHKNWELPGGLVDLEESFVSGLKREVREETGMDITVEDLVGVSDNWRGGFRFKDGAVRDVRVVEIIYRCGVVAENITLSEEHDDYVWATRTKVNMLRTFPNQRQSIMERLL